MLNLCLFFDMLYIFDSLNYQRTMQFGLTIFSFMLFHLIIPNKPQMAFNVKTLSESLILYMMVK